MPIDNFEYDVAISFAGEQRPEAEAIAQCLRSAGVRVFYDLHEQANLWGKNLYEHLADVYQNKARYCLTLVSTAYAEKVWTTHERRNAQARALSQKAEYILPVRFDETEIPGLPSTVGYLRFQDQGVAGICALLLQKIADPFDPPNKSNLTDAHDPSEFLEQLKRLPDTKILLKIWSKPRWRIWIRSTEFKRARFQDLDGCREFIRSNSVRGGPLPYPPSSINSIETGDEWIGCEIDSPGLNISRMGRWVLFRSGQYVHNRAFDEIPQLGGRIHILEILDIVTAVFEFAARMDSALSPVAAFTFELHGLAGRELTWPPETGHTDAVGKKCWCQEDLINVNRLVHLEQLKAQKRELALGVMVEMYTKFGWSDPPRTRLAEAQRQRFD